MDLGSGLARRERAILFNSARHCDVHKLVTGDMSFDYRWADGGSEAKDVPVDP